MPRELRVLTAAWANPEYDRRRKYGTGAVAGLPVGARVVVSRYSDGDLAVESTDRPHLSASGHDASRIVAQSAPTEPQSWRDYRMSQEDSFEGSYADPRVLERLWQSGDPQIRQALQAAHAAVMAEEV